MQTTTGAGRAGADMNVTPMIDVLLVLIIIFLVISPIDSRGLPAIVPQQPADGADTQPRRDIVVSIHRDGAIFINREPVSLAALEKRLRVIFRKAADPAIFVRGDREVEFRRVAEVVDVARGAGIRNVGLMTN